jgi:hypothetical protein
MTSPREPLPEKHAAQSQRSADKLDDLIRLALCDRVGQAQPPAYVWREVADRCDRTWRAKHRTTGKARRYARPDRLSQPTHVFSLWEGHVPLSLAWIIEQQMPLLRGIGWAT